MHMDSSHTQFMDMTSCPYAHPINMRLPFVHKMGGPTAHIAHVYVRIRSLLLILLILLLLHPRGVLPV